MGAVEAYRIQLATEGCKKWLGHHLAKSFTTDITYLSKCTNHVVIIIGEFIFVFILLNLSCKDDCYPIKVIYYERTLGIATSCVSISTTFVHVLYPGLKCTKLNIH